MSEDKKETINLNDLKEFFKKPEYAILSKDKLLKKFKKENIKVSNKIINEFYNSLESNQLTKVKRPKKFNSIIGYYPGDVYQIDIIVYTRFEIHNYKYILVVIDVYSRFVQVRPMTNRNNETINKNILDIFEDMGAPYRIQSDNEFNTIEFNKILKELDIKATYSDPDEINKNAIVERFNRTLENSLLKYRLVFKKYNWYKYIYDIVDIYNKTEHSTTKNTPLKIWKGEELNEQNVIRFDTDFKINDKVRVVKTKKIFNKADENIHSKELYTIKNIGKGKIELSNGKFYKPYELILANNIIYIEEDNKEEQEYKQNKKEREIKKKIKDAGLNNKDIIEGSRIKKAKVIFDI